MENPECKDNSQFIYEYIQQEVQNEDKKINNITTKLTSTLAFSGVFLKFAAEMPSEKYLFFTKIFAALFLMAAICLCGCGLYTRSGGECIKASYLRDNKYYSESEEVLREVMDQQLIAIEDLQDLIKTRKMFLNYALITLGTAGIIFGINVIVDTFIKAQHF